MFDTLMRDNIKIIKKSGEQFDNLRAFISNRSIIMMRSDIKVEPNDTVQRFLSNGEIEIFEVLKPGFSMGFCNVPSHYNMTFKRLGPGIKKTKKTKISISNNTYRTKSIINITGNPYIENQLTNLRNEISNIELSPKEKEDALRTVGEISLNLKSNKPCEEVIESLFNSLPHKRSILSIRSFLLGCFKF